MADYAIIETGSKQYRVAPKVTLDIDLLPLEDNQKEITLEKVLLVRNGKDVVVGSPYVPNAKVVCSIMGEVRAPKVISFKFRRRKNSRRIRGHRQDYIRLVVKEIVTKG